MNAPIALSMPATSLPSGSPSSGASRSSPSSGAPPGASEGAPPGAPPGAPFQSALATHWARTAAAEGHPKSSPREGADKSSHALRATRADENGASRGGGTVTPATSVSGVPAPNAVEAPATTLAGRLGAAAGATDTTGTTTVAAPATATLASTPEAGTAAAPPPGFTSAPPLTSASADPPPASAPADTSLTSASPDPPPASTPAYTPASTSAARVLPSSPAASLAAGALPSSLPASSSVGAGTSTPTMASPADVDGSPATSSPAAAHSPGPGSSLPTTSSPATANVDASPATTSPGGTGGSLSAPGSTSTAPSTARVTGAPAGSASPTLIPAPPSAFTPTTPTSTVATDPGGKPCASGPQGTEQPSLATPQTTVGATTAPSPDQSDLNPMPETSPPNAGIQNQKGAQTIPSSLSAHAASAPFQNPTVAPASAGSDTPNATAELIGPSLAAANRAQAANAQSATQTATEAPAQATAASTAAQASLDAGISTNPEASAGVAASTSGGANPLSAPGVPLQEMIDSIGATIELAARQGIAKARIELQPEELGHISIRLSQTSEGLRARVTADTPAGAQALSQGRSELRQTLGSLGLSLLQLDIGSSGQPGTGEQDGRFATNADGSNTVGATGTAEESKAHGESQENTRPVGPPLGKIVDVLA